MGDGKSSPFNFDGKSGAEGNKSASQSTGLDGCHRGIDRPQKMRPSDFNPDSVPPAGRSPKFDPSSDREGLVTQTATGGIKAGKPFKLGGKGPAMPASNAEPDEGGPVGDVPAEDSAD